MSTFVEENQITLGELTVEEKTNEITVIQELLNLIDIEGAIVTAAAMRCQKKADYNIGLKNNSLCYIKIQGLFFRIRKRTALY